MTIKTYQRTKPRHAELPADRTFDNACFLADLLDGTVRATARVDVLDGEGRRVRIDYDEPEREGARSR